MNQNKCEVEKLALTLFLKTLRKPPALISEDDVRCLVESVHEFVSGRLWIYYDPILDTIICETRRLGDSTEQNV